MYYLITFGVVHGYKIRKLQGKNKYYKNISYTSENYINIHVDGSFDLHFARDYPRLKCNFILVHVSCTLTTAFKIFKRLLHIKHMVLGYAILPTLSVVNGHFLNFLYV